MKKAEIINLIKLDPYSSTAKYLQIANSVIREIGNNNIQVGENMPSINELSFELDIARDTVERGYKHLKSIGVINAVPRRGYFIVNAEFRKSIKVFLLFNKLSIPKKTVYDSFVATLGEHAIIDFYIYNNDFLLFKRFLSQNKEEYTHIVIIPHFVEVGENVHELLNLIPKEKLVLLDKIIPEVDGEFAASYTDFEQDIYNGLSDGLDQLSKYHTIKIIFPEHSYYPKEILKGFVKFCQDYTFNYKVIPSIENEPICEGDVFINLMEDDLVVLIERILVTDLKIGENVGIISYNETPIKKIILNGITTISSDFRQMGITAAELILANSRDQVKVPFKLTLRASL